LSYAVLAEADSDANAIAVFVRRLATRENLRVAKQVFKGKSLLFKKGAAALRDFVARGADKAIVCVDADGPTDTDVRMRIDHEIIGRASIQCQAAAIVPVQELEAWLLADIACATQIFRSWRPVAEQNPEAISSPKERLVRISRDHRSRPRFDPVIHNEQIARYLDLDAVARKCPSFKRLVEFVKGS
jgi:hypothetical protein